MSDDKLSRSEFALVEQTLLEKIQKWKSEREQITTKIDAVHDTLRKLRLQIGGNSKDVVNIVVNEDFEVFASIYKEASGRYLTRDHVFTQYLLKTGNKLTNHRYKKYLGGYGSLNFKMKGSRATAKWKIVEKVTD